MLRGYLLGSDGSSRAEREVYAGNIIDEEDLLNLYPLELRSLLSVKEGQESRNVSVPPGTKISLMIIFDDLPPDTIEYRVEVVGFSKVEQRG